MHSQVHALPLTRRLIGRYLMFGLAGIFACVSLAITFTIRGNFTDLVAFAVVPSLALILLGAFVLQRTVRVSEAIEFQLRQITAHTSATTSILKPLADADSTAVGWNTMLQHIGDQRAMHALESRLSGCTDSADGKRWWAVCNALNEGIAVCDHNGVVMMANNAFASMLDLDRGSETVGQDMATILSTRNSAPAALANLLNSRGSFAAELRKGADLATGVWRVNRIPLMGDAFPEHASLWTIRDVTHQKLAEEMRNQFVFTATHELRTPLANIKAYAETLATVAEIDLDQQKSFYNIINTEATRLARFVDELLSVSQMEAGAVTILRHETDVERLLGEVVEKSRPQMEEKHLLFESKLPAKLPKLRVDKDKLTASLVNLLGNAVKYTPEQGTIRLVVEVDETHIQFHVEDTGIGIAEEELPRVCEKFFRSNDARVQNSTGTGLGLAFAQEVARLHGGKISVKSEIEKGSRFTLSLPLN